MAVSHIAQQLNTLQVSRPLPTTKIAKPNAPPNVDAVLRQAMEQSIPPECCRLSFDALYEVGQVLGGGGFGTVYSAIRRYDELPLTSILSETESAGESVKDCDCAPALVTSSPSL